MRDKTRGKGMGQTDRIDYDPQGEFVEMPQPDEWVSRVTRLRQDVDLLRRCGVLVVVVTGSRNWDWSRVHPVRQALERVLTPGLIPSQVLVVHGDARGLDKLADRVACHLGMNVLSLPAPWDQFGKSAGPIRNQALIDLQPDLVLGFPLGASPGTRDCLRRASAANIATTVVEG
jgi:hypothetical protein